MIFLGGGFGETIPARTMASKKIMIFLGNKIYHPI